MSELIVVTIIVAADGGIKIPKVSSRDDLTKALNKLGALRSEQVSGKSSLTSTSCGTCLTSYERHNPLGYCATAMLAHIFTSQSLMMCDLTNFCACSFWLLKSCGPPRMRMTHTQRMSCS